MASYRPATVDDLQLFIMKGAQLEFDWVTTNCGFWVCDWIKQRMNIDPVNHLRNKKFRDSLAFKRFVIRSGGNEKFSREIANGAGLLETNSPLRGDVGLIETGSGPTMAICIGDGRWAGKSSHGVVIDEFPLIVAWQIMPRTWAV